MAERGGAGSSLRLSSCTEAAQRNDKTHGNANSHVNSGVPRGAAGAQLFVHVSRGLASHAKEVHVRKNSVKVRAMAFDPSASSCKPWSECVS